jgi:predicted transcriptional regulator of viral defense system
MNYLEFKNRMFDLGCFNTQQVYTWKPDFDRNNFGRWVNKGLLIRLRQGYYTFPEYVNKPDFTLLFANRIYRPSYISLHTALAFYGIIPEAVVQITSVTSLKTINFKNEIGEYQYKSVKKELMFGYDIKPLASGHSLYIARPEKALLDLLYLNPFYNADQDLEDLRLDLDFLLDELDVQRLDDYLLQFESKALQKRVKRLKNIYEL